MKQNEVIKLAREAGFVTGTRDSMDGIGGMPYVTPIGTGTCLSELQRFAALVRNSALKEAAQWNWTEIIRDGSLVARSDAETLGDRVAEKLMQL